MTCTTSEEKCSVCKSGLTVDSKTGACICVTKDPTGCAKCTLNPNICDVCKPGFKLDHGVCVCVPAEASCEICRESPDVCFKCKTGFKITNSVDPHDNKKVLTTCVC